MNKILAMVTVVLLLAAFTVGCKVQPAPGNLAGSISWQSQAAVAGVTVNVWGTGNTKVASGVSDKDGHYSITKVPEGKGYLVTCHQAASGEIAEKNWMFENVSINSKGTTQIDMTYDNAIKGAVLPSIYQ
jgi:hypothetical protein